MFNVKEFMMKNDKFWAVFILITAGLSARLLPHPSNWSPVAAVALFSGAYLRPRFLAFAIPLASLFLSDLFLGLYAELPVIYALFALTTFMGTRWAQNRPSRIFGLSLLSSVIFFVGSNFAVWLTGALYSRTFDGLVSCYVMALPFFSRSLMGDLFFNGLLFGLYAWMHQARKAAQAS